MLPFKRHASESGISLVETMVASAIALVFTYGGYQMLGRTQKYMALKQKTQLGKTEGSDLAAVIKKDWDYRLYQYLPNVPGIPGVPATGYKLFSKTNVEGCLANCPKVQLWIRRTLPNSTKFIDEVTIENTCVSPDPTTKFMDSTVNNLVNRLDFTNAKVVNTACGICPKGQVPAVRITGVDMTTKQVMLQAENRLFPSNVANNQRKDQKDRLPMKQNGVLGMQVCFNQTALKQPLNVDIRSIVVGDALDQDGKVKELMSLQNTQVFPYDNFANIPLEQ